MTQYTKHYLNEDQVLEKQRKIKSKTSLSKPAKVKSLPKLKKKKRRVLSPQPSLKTTISEEYIFHLPNSQTSIQPLLTEAVPPRLNAALPVVGHNESENGYGGIL